MRSHYDGLGNNLWSQAASYGSSVSSRVENSFVNGKSYSHHPNELRTGWHQLCPDYRGHPSDLADAGPPRLASPDGENQSGCESPSCRTGGDADGSCHYQSLSGNAKATESHKC